MTIPTDETWPKDEAFAAVLSELAGHFLSIRASDPGDPCSFGIVEQWEGRSEELETTGELLGVWLLSGDGLRELNEAEYRDHMRHFPRSASLWPFVHVKFVILEKTRKRKVQRVYYEFREGPRAGVGGDYFVEVGDQGPVLRPDAGDNYWVS